MAALSQLWASVGIFDCSGTSCRRKAKGAFTKEESKVRILSPVAHGYKLSLIVRLPPLLKAFPSQLDKGMVRFGARQYTARRERFRRAIMSVANRTHAMTCRFCSRETLRDNIWQVSFSVTATAADCIMAREHLYEASTASFNVIPRVTGLSGAWNGSR